MSTLNYSNYENHRPHSQIWQNLEIVPEPSPDRKTLVIIGSSDGQMDSQAHKGLVLINGTASLNKLISAEGVTAPSSANKLYEAAEIALVAGGGRAFYVLDVKEPAFVEKVTDPGESGSESDKAAYAAYEQYRQDLKDAWTNSLKILSNSDRSMFIAPLTYDSEISDLVKIAAQEMSSPDNQKWKRVYQGLPACVYGNKIYDNLDELNLKGDELVKAITDSNSTYSNLDPSQLQRSINIWTAGAIKYEVTDGELVTKSITNMMVAVGIAALRASLLVQQGLSMKQITWIAGIPNAYLLFDKDDLNKIAVGSVEDNGGGKGVMIITQDDADNEVYVRHQLTSDLTRGIMYYEDSVGVNVDAICYGIKDIIRPYLGQRNNTDETLLEIKNRCTDYLLELTNTGVSIEARRIGPQIKSVDLESIIVELDGDLKDRVNIQFDIEVPLPINTVKVHVNAYADLNNR